MPAEKFKLGHYPNSSGGLDDVGAEDVNAPPFTKTPREQTMTETPPRSPPTSQDQQQPPKDRDPRRSAHSRAGAGRPRQYGVAPIRATPSLPTKPLDWKAGD
jgi:hypothetical protein